MNDEHNLELERLKKDLEDVETYLQEFNTFLPLPVCSVNPSLIVISVNDAFEQATGAPAVSAVGKKIEDFFLEKDAVSSFLLSRVEGKKFARGLQVTLLSEHYGKRSVNLTVSGRTDRSGTFIGFFIGLNDITELKDLQERLEEKVRDQTADLLVRTQELEKSRNDIIFALSKVEEERRKTHSLVMNLSDGIMYVNVNGTIEMINPKAEVVLNIRNTNALERNFFELGTAGLSEEFLVLSSHIKRGVRLERESIELSEGIFVEVSTIDISGSEDSVVGTIIILHDISKDKALENLKGEFISVAAHQMRTPLAAIKWAFELLLASDETKIAGDLKKIAENGFESTNRILEIVNSFLSVDSTESSVRSDYIFAPVNVSKVVEEVFASLTVAAKEKDLELVYNNEGQSLPFVRGDQRKLIVVMQNLIENAIKYTSNGGAVTVSVERQDESLLISVTDQGIGIPDSEQVNIFSKFFRAGNAKRTETDGNGLGLYTTKRIVERHGGDIWFESTEGLGTTFQFTIPLYKQ